MRLPHVRAVALEVAKVIVLAAVKAIAQAAAEKTAATIALGLVILLAHVDVLAPVSRDVSGHKLVLDKKIINIWLNTTFQTSNPAASSSKTPSRRPCRLLQE